MSIFPKSERWHRPKFSRRRVDEIRKVEEKRIHDFSVFQKEAREELGVEDPHKTRTTIMVEGIIQDPKLSPNDRFKEYIIERNKGFCSYCGKKVRTGHIDHIIPVSRGGLTTPENCTLACRACNTYKGDRTPEEANMLFIPVEDLGKPMKIVYLPLRPRKRS